MGIFGNRKKGKLKYYKVNYISAYMPGVRKEVTVCAYSEADAIAVVISEVEAIDTSSPVVRYIRDAE